MEMYRYDKIPLKMLPFRTNDQIAMWLTLVHPLGSFGLEMKIILKMRKFTMQSGMANEICLLPLMCDKGDTKNVFCMLAVNPSRLLVNQVVIHCPGMQP